MFEMFSLMFFLWFFDFFAFAGCEWAPAVNYLVKEFHLLAVVDLRQPKSFSVGLNFTERYGGPYSEGIAP